MLESLNQFQFILVALNLIILYWILRKILFKPVTEFMEKRTKSIEDSIEDADRQKNEAGEMKRAYEKQLKEAKLESERIINEAAAKAGLVSAKLIDDAKQEVQTMLSAARKEIEQERRQMVKEVKNEVAGLAFAAASKVVSANMDTKDNRELVEQFLDQMGAA